MKRILFALCAVILLAGLAPASSFALDFSGGGGRVGYVDPEDSDGGLAIGGHLEFEQPGSNWHFRPNVMWWDGDPYSGLNINLDGFYHFGSQSKAVPYLGAGIGISSVDVEGPADGDSDPAMNFFGGLQLPAGNRATMFFEGRYVASDISQAGIFFGLTVR